MHYILWQHSLIMSSMRHVLRRLRENDPAFNILNLLMWHLTDTTELASALMHNTMLTTAYLNSSHIVNIAPLMKALETNTALTSLDLGDNVIRDIGSLANMFAKNTTLNWLSLSRNKISNIDSLVALAENQTLIILHLDNNQITNIDSLRIALANNTALAYIGLAKNNILDISPLVEALKTNTALTSVSYVCDSDESREMYYPIQLQLLRNRRLYNMAPTLMTLVTVGNRNETLHLNSRLVRMLAFQFI